MKDAKSVKGTKSELRSRYRLNLSEFISRSYFPRSNKHLILCGANLNHLLASNGKILDTFFWNCFVMFEYKTP